MYYKKYDGIPNPGSLKELWFELIEAKLRMEEITKTALLEKAIRGTQEEVKELYSKLFNPYVKESREKISENNIAERLKHTEELLNTPITIKNGGEPETSFEDSINLMKDKLNG